MSFAAYRALSDLFPSVQGIFDGLMQQQLGYDRGDWSTDITTPAE